MLQRWLRYAEATGVRFEVVPRHRGWGALGLPDLRGFAPHRRVVRRFAGEPPAFPRRDEVAAGRTGLDDLAVDELWLLHDLAHVLWYDVATMIYGRARWRERDFFVEHHLVSEAFAVLLLDYHALARTRHHGLAVDLDAAAWEAARARVRRLPELDSLAMAQALVGHYLGGDVALFRAPLAASGGDAELLSRWRDHEVSYADKQRSYVLWWWSALHGEPPAPQQAVVDDPTIAELVWLTLRKFTVDPEPAFEAHVASAARQLAKERDLLDALPELPPRAATRPDFRFADAAAFDGATLRARVDAATEPAAAELFLFWQLLATTPPEARSAGERAAIAALAASVQTATPDRASWSAVRAICRRLLDVEPPAPRPEWRRAFFLP